MRRCGRTASVRVKASPSAALRCNSPQRRLLLARARSQHPGYLVSHPHLPGQGQHVTSLLASDGFPLVGEENVDKPRYGRKRHAAADTMGLLLEVQVTEANLHGVRAFTD